MTVPGDSPLAAISPGEYLARVRLERLLARLSPPENASSSSLYLRPGELEFLARTQRDNLAARQWNEALYETGAPVLVSDTGVVGLRADAHGLLIVPPFPVSESRLSPDWNAEPMLGILAARYTIGVVLLRLGRFSVAVYRGEDLQSSKTDARYVKGRHRAGGSSARRFERIREGQMRKIYDKTCAAARAQLEPVQAQMDFVVLGGERLTLNGFLNVCPMMKRLEGKILSRRLNIRDPKRDTLEGVGQMLTESRVYPVSF